MTSTCSYGSVALTASKHFHWRAEGTGAACPSRGSARGQHRLSAHYRRAATEEERHASTRAHPPISLATYKRSFLRNRFLPEVVSIFHVPKRLGELLAGGAEEITGLSGGRHRSAALSFRQANTEVKDGSGSGTACSCCRETVIPHKQL